ncbi:MAG: hypothetical protein AAF614_02600 [Chloroflexota bacterium]
MSRYDFDQLIKRWGQDKLTTEQAIGHILQHLQGIMERLGKVELFIEEKRSETVEKPKKKGKPKKK